ncbi:MAG TPA: hypothetical protein VK177_20935 [Flavobacteriales bacterium]|nr:hypothetical protein [Flavobacteriales bacterium]
MRAIFISFFLVFSFLLAGFIIPLKKDDNYKVIKVNGQIVVVQTGKQLAAGDVYTENTALDFKTAESKATVINAEKGRFILTSQAKSSKASNLIPAINNIASRNGPILNIVDIQNLFAGNLCVIEKLKVKIAAPVFKMGGKAGFFVFYTYRGEQIPKMLSNIGDTLVIDRSELYKIDGKPIDTPDDHSVSLYYKNEKGQQTYISDFNLVFPNENELKNEIKMLVDESPTKSNSQKLDDISAFMLDFYGKTEAENLKPWLKKNFGIK